MLRTPSPARLAIIVAVAVTLCAASLEMPAQQERRPGADNRDNRDNRDNQRRPRWTIEDGATSENSDMLKRMLQRFPESDTDKNGVLDAKEARAFIEKQRERWRELGNWRRDRIEQTFDNIAYGPDDKHRLDLYLTQSAEPAPLVIFFHGGQFITGDENDIRPLDVKALLEAGISVASIDYRETNVAPFPGPFEDAARALQFIRFYAEKLNIDPDRIAGHGEEAGGNLALYLALHDDLADDEVRKQLESGEIEDPRTITPAGPIPQPEPKTQSEDQPEDAPDEQANEGDESEAQPVEEVLLQELIPWDTPALAAMSTRLVGAVARHPIASFDPRAWAQHKLPMNDHERLMTKYLDVRYLEPLNDQAVITLVEQVSPLALISRDDPALLLLSQYEDLPLEKDTVWTIMRHHPKQSELIAKEMRLKGNSATVRYKGMNNDPGTSAVEFLTNQLK